MLKWLSRTVNALRHDALRAAWLYLVLLGVGCLIVYALIDREANPGWADALILFANAVIVGGVFSAVTQSFQFHSLYGNALKDIIYGNEFLDVRSDIEDLWHRITDRLCNQKFPGLSSKISSIVLNDMLPRNKDYYLESHYRTIHVTGYDEHNGFVWVRDHIQSEVVPHHKSDGFSYTFTHTSRHPENFKLERFQVDGRDVSGCDPENTESSSGTTSTYRVRLESAKEHTVERISVYTIDMKNFPYFKFTNRNYIRRTRITVGVKEAVPLEVMFVPFGPKSPFQNLDYPLDQEAGKALRKEHEGVLLPGQGYIILVRPSDA